MRKTLRQVWKFDRAECGTSGAEGGTSGAERGTTSATWNAGWVPTLTTIIRLAVGLDCKVTDLVGMFDKKNLRPLVKKHSGRDR
jgi:hypothetical protein